MSQTHYNIQCSPQYVGSTLLYESEPWAFFWLVRPAHLDRINSIQTQLSWDLFDWVESIRSKNTTLVFNIVFIIVFKLALIIVLIIVFIIVLIIMLIIMLIIVFIIVLNIVLVIRSIIWPQSLLISRVDTRPEWTINLELFNLETR